MRRILTVSCLSLLIVTFGFSAAQAQCPGCTIDPTCGVGINPIEPTLCPEVLPNGTQGQPYDENLTFFMPRDFTDAESGADVTLNTIILTNITGMPQGLSYECNEPNCSYTITVDPVTQRGCVKICGIPTVPGNYNIVVNVVANVTTPIGTINQPSGFTIPLTIDPAPGGNCCFSYDPPSACGSLDVTYEGLLNFEPLQPTEYSWDFDNGNTAAGAAPPVQSYPAPGDYYPELTTTVYNYVLTDVSVTASGSNWCGDIEEVSIGGVCQGAPDMFFDYANSGTDVTSSIVDNNLSASWSNLDISLNSLLFSLTFWDDDNISQNDNLGALAFNVSGPGTFTFQNSEVFGSYTISTEVDIVYVTTDTVSVFPVPATPQISFSPAQNVCVGDSVLLSAPAGPYQYQWLQSESFISDSIATWVDITDYYSLLIIDTTYYCQAMSDSVLVQILPFLSPPVITYNSSSGNLEIVNEDGNSVEWFNDGVSVAGQTGDTLAEIIGSGPYTATLTNIAGCSATSIEFWLCIAGGADAIANDTVCCGDELTLNASGFSISPFTTVAWAFTPEADGPVTSQAEATAANDAGQVLGIVSLGETIDYTRNCSTLADSLVNGSYYVTPFAIENPNVEPLTYDTLQGCKPYIVICPELNAVDDNWEIFPMIFTFPDGSTLNVNDAQAAGLPINQELLDFATGGTLPCMNLTDIFTGDPNGVWNVSITNTGTTAIDMVVPDFIAINYADTCNLITEDEEYQIDGIEITANPGQTVSTTFNIPPIPGGYPNVDDNCVAFGTPILVTFADCFPELTNGLTVTGTTVNSTIIDGNGYIDVTIAGGTQPYSMQWDDGPTTEDRFNLVPGTYTLNVTDAGGYQASGTWDITGVTGIEDDLGLYGFSLGQNVPNPTNGTTVISFSSRQRADYDFIVSDPSGREVARMQVSAGTGENRITFDGSSLSSGMYLYSLTDGVSVLTERMVIRK